MVTKHYYEIIQNLPIHLLSDTYEYISRSDTAHNEEHIRAVVTEADHLVCTYSQRYHNSVIAAALMHDLGCAIKNGRDTHEVFSAQIARGLMAEYSHLEIFMTGYILKAILEHRGSFSGVRTSPMSKLIAAADRGRPNAAVLFMRAYVYTKEINDVCHDVAIQHALEYNRGKYGYNGYARMRDNELIMQFYPNEAIAIEKTFEEATEETVLASLEKLGVSTCY